MAKGTASMGKGSESLYLTLSEVTLVCYCYTTTRVGKAREGTVLTVLADRVPGDLFFFSG